MKELLEFIVKNIIGEDFDLVEESEEGRVDFLLKIPGDKAGLIIGRGGNTIKSIQDILRIKATLEKKYVNIKVEPLS